MKSPLELLQRVLEDSSIWCCTSTTRDFDTITRRFEHEGMSFLTISLPKFASDFERCLSQSSVDPVAFAGFSRCKALPRFLGGLLDLVFDRSSGRLLDVPSHDAIFFIRQITLMFKKILLDCSKEREEGAYAKYIECEEELRDFEGHLRHDDLHRLGRIGDLLWAVDLSIIDRKVYEGDFRPKHGPGVTADRTIGNGKFDCRTWHTRLEEYFPSSEHRIPNLGYSYVLDGINFLEPEAETPVKVISVPKTLKTPRIIAVEPTCMQYTQQALMELFVDRLEESDTLRGAIGFTEQLPNQVLAQVGSITGRLATIDLSEASDRVSNLLVKRIFQNWPSLSGAVQACRSLTANVPGHGNVSLTKFASMGSALCFPIEAMVFLTVILYGYEQSLNRLLTRNDLYFILGKVRVYGDDIIVPVDIVRHVVEALSLFGFKVNSNKSFWTGKFRESCGKDYYDGSDVSVTYVRRLFPAQRGDVSEMISAVSLRNQLFKAGLWRSAGYMDDLVRRLAPFPNVLETSPVLGRLCSLGHETQKWCPSLQAPLVKGYVVKASPKKSKISPEGALQKFFLKRGREPIHDVKHLERFGRPESVDIKLRWASPF